MYQLKCSHINKILIPWANACILGSCSFKLMGALAVQTQTYMSMEAMSMKVDPWWVTAKAHCGASLLAGHPLLDFNRKDQLIPVILCYGGVIIGSLEWNLLDDDLGDCNKIREAFDTCFEFLHDVHITLCECTLENEAMVKCKRLGLTGI